MHVSARVMGLPGRVEQGPPWGRFCRGCEVIWEANSLGSWPCKVVPGWVTRWQEKFSGGEKEPRLPEQPRHSHPCPGPGVRAAGGCEERSPLRQSGTVRAAPCIPHGQGPAGARCQAAPYPTMQAGKARRQPAPWKAMPVPCGRGLSHRLPGLQPGRSGGSRPVRHPLSCHGHHPPGRQTSL